MPRIELQANWTDDDGMLRIDVSAANSSTSAAMEVYAYPTDIQAFAEQLENFPSSIKHEVVWESGTPDPKWYGHMLMRARVVDGVGHSALEVLMDVRGSPPYSAKSNFYLRCNPADINVLGTKMQQWLSVPTEKCIVEWRDV